MQYIEFKKSSYNITDSIYRNNVLYNIKDYIGIHVIIRNNKE